MVLFPFSFLPPDKCWAIYAQKEPKKIRDFVRYFPKLKFVDKFQ